MIENRKPKKITKCKVKTHISGKKFLVEIRGYCDANNPNKRTDRNLEFDVPE